MAVECSVRCKCHHVRAIQAVWYAIRSVRALACAPQWFIHQQARHVYYEYQRALRADPPWTLDGRTRDADDAWSGAWAPLGEHHMHALGDVGLLFLDLHAARSFLFRDGRGAAGPTAPEAAAELAGAEGYLGPRQWRDLRAALAEAETESGTAGAAEAESAAVSMADVATLLVFVPLPIVT